MAMAAPLVAESGGGSAALGSKFSMGKSPGGMSNFGESLNMGGMQKGMDSMQSLQNLMPDNQNKHSSPADSLRKPSPMDSLNGSNKQKEEEKKELSSPPASPKLHGLDSVKKAANSLMELASNAETALGAAMGVVQGVTQVATNELGQHSPSHSLKPH